MKNPIILARKAIHLLRLRLKQRTHEGRLHYIYERHGSDKLVIVFSAFANHPTYHYYKTLSTVKADKLFILDDFGIRGSYYWFNQGSDRPRILVESLINKIVSSGGGYSALYTLGSSKGGACAIYFGLKFGATEVFSGDNQYLVGDYLNTDRHQHIFRAMMGPNAGLREHEILNAMIPDVVKQHAGTHTIINVLYSPLEHTYPEHISHMLSDFRTYHIPHTEQVESFTNHNDVGQYFPSYILSHLSRCLTQKER